MKRKRIGFFAGTFDPIHDGHLDIACSAVSNLGLDSLYFLIEKNGWGGKKPESIKHRVNMVDLSLKNHSKLNILEISHDRFDINNTLKYIERKFIDCELYFVMGADVFLNMNKHQWPGLESLLKHYIVVYERNKITELEITMHAKSLGIVTAILPSKHSHHSSTDVRLQLQNKSMYVPKAVSDYIDEKKLYM